MTAFAQSSLPDSLFSDFIELPESGLTAPFCQEWNPDFPYRGGQCCANVPRRGTNHAGFCHPARAKGDFCNEMTQEQKHYLEEANRGHLGDVLALIKQEYGRNGNQSFCSPNNGFLAWGRPVVPSLENRIALRHPGRCTYFGTDQMVGMLEWVGRQINQKFSSPQLADLQRIPSSKYTGLKWIIGDISAPKGGCLKGRGGRKGHSSHTSGRDVDVGFLYAKDGQNSPIDFHKKFDPELNWWLLKQIFHNPFACVKVIFLDRKLITKLRQTAQNDPEWQVYRNQIRHVRNHKNHFHVRIQDTLNMKSCKPGSNAELDELNLEEEEG